MWEVEEAGRNEGLGFWIAVRWFSGWNRAIVIVVEVLLRPSFCYGETFVNIFSF